MIDLEEERVFEEKQAESVKQHEDEKQYKGKLGKIFVKLRDFTGSEKTAKMILGLMVFAVVLIFLLILASIVNPRAPRQQPIAPTPTPTPTPLPLQPTPSPFKVKEGTIEELIKDIDMFDVEQKDLLPPKFDLEISL